jgi:hypothetical protein
MKQTAMQQHIEWLKSTIKIAEEQTPVLVNILKLCLNDAEQKLSIEKEQKISLVERLMEYTKESHSILGHDEREASEFVDIFYKETFKSE